MALGVHGIHEFSVIFLNIWYVALG